MEKRIRERKVITFYPQTRGKNNGGKSTLKRVAAYCRVSSKSDEQLHSLKAQVDYYKQYITSNPDYEFAGIYENNHHHLSGRKSQSIYHSKQCHQHWGRVRFSIAKA